MIKVMEEVTHMIFVLNNQVDGHGKLIEKERGRRRPKGKQVST